MKRLRRFFPYYGSRWNLAKHYPGPTYPTIIEPFAGSAGYSLHYYERRIILSDINPIVFGVWDFLISGDTRTVRRLPDVVLHIDEISDFPQEVRWLVGFWLNPGCSSPRKSLGSAAKKDILLGDSARCRGSYWDRSVKARIIGQMPIIRHWVVRNLDYGQLLDPGLSKAATYFVDPPFQTQGHHYPYHSIDYGRLAKWCRRRHGQVIVCESDDAAWLPFKPLKTQTTAGLRARQHHDGVWIKDGP